MSIVNSITPEVLTLLINSCAEKPFDIKSENIITDICKNLEYKRENIAIFKLIFQNAGFYPLPDYKNIFFQSCTNGLIELVECLLKNMEPKDIPLLSELNHSIIYGTLLKGHTNVAKLLIEKKIFYMYSGKLGTNGLTIACNHGFIETVKLLLEAGVSANITDDSNIYNAAKQGHYEIVKLLLEYPDVNPNNFPNSAIRAAAQKNYDDIVKLILQKRTNLRPEDFKFDDDIDKKIISMHSELYPVLPIMTPADLKSDIISMNTELYPNQRPFNNGRLNEILKQLKEEMNKEKISEIIIKENNIMFTMQF